MITKLEPEARAARNAGLFVAGSAGSALAVVMALAFLALHLPYLPQSLEDLDSINFALGVRHFDVAHHQPHPPGYPVYIVIAKAMHAAVPDEVRALGLVSVVAGTLGVLAIAALYFRLAPLGRASAWVPAAALALTSPLYWFTAVRPLSDMAGLAASVAVQTLTLGAATARRLYVASFCAGLATGLRSQVAWLTLPLLLWSAACQPAGREGQRSRLGVPGAVVGSFLAGMVVWALPLVLVTGGPTAYWRALFDQGAEDLGNIQMLWTRHGARDVADALYYAFAAPWAAWPIALIVLLCAALGIARLWRQARQALFALALAFGPYLAFDLLFQETFTSRYALPLVVPIAYLAAAGLRWAPHEIAWLLALPIVMFDAHVGGTSIAAYAQQNAPAFRLLDDMKRAAAATGQRPVLAPDRRESFDLRRPVLWIGASMPAIVRQLPAPPQHEWLEAVAYWNAGGRDPMWFLVDPKRSTIDLVQHGSPFEYRWPLPYPVLMSGVRPNDVAWYPVTRPEWYVGEGWALTPEAAGVSAADHRDLSQGSIDAWFSRDISPGVLMFGGRNFEPTGRPRITLAFDGRVREEFVAASGAFLRFVSVPYIDFMDGNPPVEYVRTNIAAAPPARVAVEQFDASKTRPIFGFGDGWHEQEFNPQLGGRWRWLSAHGELRYVARSPAILHIEAESPRKYYSRSSTVTVRSGAAVLYQGTFDRDFSFDVMLPATPLVVSADGTITPATVILDTDQVHVPAEHSWRRTADHRQLGLRIFKVELRPAS